jgi:hypothetical protein
MGSVARSRVAALMYGWVTTKLLDPLTIQAQHKYQAPFFAVSRLGSVSSGSDHELLDKSLSLERDHQEKMHDSRSLGTTEAGIDNCA